MKKRNLKEMAGISILAAIIVVMAAIPQLGYLKVPILAFDLTLLFVPVLIGTMLFDKKGGLILGLVFGLSSLAVAIFRPATPFDITFRNPLVSVLPRLIFPMIFLFILDLLRKLDSFKSALITTIFTIGIAITFITTNMSKVFIIFILILAILSLLFTIYCYKHKDKKLLYILPTFISVIIHGILVLSVIVLFYQQTIIEMFQVENAIRVIGIVLVSNSFLEAILSSIIMQLITPIIRKTRDE
ncbi:MAG: ECF transporter S component [Bacilli bacterium]